MKPKPTTPTFLATKPAAAPHERRYVRFKAFLRKSGPVAATRTVSNPAVDAVTP